MTGDCLRVIIFDLDGTLRLNLPSGGEVFSDYVATLGVPLSDEDRERAARWEHYYWASSRPLREDLERFANDDEAFWNHYTYRRLLVLCGSPKLAEALAPQVSQYMRLSYQPQAVVPDGIYAVLEKLQGRRFSLGVVSNRKHPYCDELEALGLMRFFPYTLAAGEVNLWKPDPALFQHVARQLGVRPGQALYVGDNYFADVLGARQAGWKTVLFDPRGLFHEPGCAVIGSFDELPEQIERMNPCGNNV
jgi:HAD superfamily hydrolase (TIGR01509 family)